MSAEVVNGSSTIRSAWCPGRDGPTNNGTIRSTERTDLRREAVNDALRRFLFDVENFGCACAPARCGASHALCSPESPARTAGIPVPLKPLRFRACSSAHDANTARSSRAADRRGRRALYATNKRQCALRGSDGASSPIKTSMAAPASPRTVARCRRALPGNNASAALSGLSGGILGSPPMRYFRVLPDRKFPANPLKQYVRQLARVHCAGARV
jgi:hypothetical protein